MTLEERIEKAAVALMLREMESPEWLRERHNVQREFGVFPTGPRAFGMLTIAKQTDFTKQAEAAIRAAFPELFTSPPTHKIAVLEPTRDMARIGANADDSTDVYVALSNVYRAMIKASP